MIYKPTTNDVIAACTYGSRLYGTETLTSDYDFKAITLPKFNDLIMAKKLKGARFRFDNEGNVVGDQAMPPGGWEAEHIPVHKFVEDYLGGQAYAVELAFAVMQKGHLEHLTSDTESVARAYSFYLLCVDLCTNFAHQNVQGMVGFATKQTFDYVHRGERLNSAKLVLAQIDVITDTFKTPAGMVAPRLDSNYVEDHLVLDVLAKICDLKIGVTENNNKILRTLELNGRSYLETTALSHLRTAVQKLVDQYGERSTNASQIDVDWKSLSHAVRVYQQVLELLRTGKITFPRDNAVELLKIKSGNEDRERVRELLCALDTQVLDALQETTLPKVDEVMRQAVQARLFDFLCTQYRINLV